jgi:putative transposase
MPTRGSGKYELIYPGDFAPGQDLFSALENYLDFYYHQRPHQALGYQTPANLFSHHAKRRTSSS